MLGSTAEAASAATDGMLLSGQGQAEGQRALRNPEQGAQPRYFGLHVAAKLFLALSPAREAEDVPPAAAQGNGGGSVKWGLFPFSF